MVTFQLEGRTHSYFTADNRLVSRVKRTATSDGAGAFSATVDRNDLLTPTGSRWKVTCPDAGFSKHINVNTDAGINVITATDSPP